ncbi:MAG: Spy/CpxP family protein refolding chaperone [Alphaproteobacteria bacterium]|nr:Spy/CpxP family protein refolding chaperone [Alphaproteobacteria bacterium]
MKKYLLTSICAAVLALSAFNVSADEGKADMDRPEPPKHEMKMQKMHDDLADKLKLTDEQREKAKKIHEEGRAKMKPLMDEGRELHEKMDKLRKENMAEFEAILTDEQKAELEKIKKDHKGKMRHNHQRKDGKMMRGNHQMPRPDNE